MDDFGMPLAKRWEILFDKLAAENPMPKSQAHFGSLGAIHRLEHLPPPLYFLLGFVSLGVLIRA
jgi:hypothetical protein